MPEKLGTLKAIIRKRDIFCCECLVEYAQDVDHITPKMFGGEDTLENLQGLCVRCHRIKTKKEMTLWRKHRRVLLTPLSEMKPIPDSTWTWVEGVDYDTPRTIELKRLLY